MGNTERRARAQFDADAWERDWQARPQPVAPVLYLMASTIRTDPVASVLDRLFALSQREDPLAKDRLIQREAALGRRLTQIERYEIYGEAPPLAISREVGRLIHLLAASRPPHRIVEFGASHGISAIHLAAAIRDAGEGSLITTEVLPAKAKATRENLGAAGLDDLVDVRVGDALQTLRNLGQDVDLLFLDGRNDLYLQVLALIEPRLARSCLVVADLSHDDPDLAPYLAHIRNPDGQYDSICLPLDAGIEVSVLR